MYFLPPMTPPPSTPPPQIYRPDGRRDTHSRELGASSSEQWEHCHRCVGGCVDADGCDAAGCDGRVTTAGCVGGCVDAAGWVDAAGCVATAGCVYGCVYACVQGLRELLKSMKSNEIDFVGIQA